MLFDGRSFVSGTRAVSDSLRDADAVGRLSAAGLYAASTMACCVWWILLLGLRAGAFVDVDVRGPMIRMFYPSSLNKLLSVTILSRLLRLDAPLLFR